MYVLVCVRYCASLQQRQELVREKRERKSEKEEDCDVISESIVWVAEATPRKRGAAISQDALSFCSPRADSDHSLPCSRIPEQIWEQMLCGGCREVVADGSRDSHLQPKNVQAVFFLSSPRSLPFPAFPHICKSEA